MMTSSEYKINSTEYNAIDNTVLHMNSVHTANAIVLHYLGRSTTRHSQTTMSFAGRGLEAS